MSVSAPKAKLRLAALIAAPQAGEAAMFDDMVAMSQALQSRGVPADQIICLHGRLNKTAVLSFLRTIQEKVKQWMEGTLFIHISGHGFFAGETVATARPGLMFGSLDSNNDKHCLFWDDFFAALALPDNVNLILLPDL